MKNNILKYKKIQYIKNYFNSLLDFIAPAHCIVCKKYYNYEIKKSKFICNACYDNLNFAIEKELILNKILQNFPQDKCFISEATSLISLKNNINYLEIIHSFKYLRFQSIGIEFSKLLSQRIIYDNMQNYDYIVPIPIHFAKNRERGFNQSDIIAKTISNELNLKSRNIITQLSLGWGIAKGLGLQIQWGILNTTSDSAPTLTESMGNFGLQYQFSYSPKKKSN